MAIFASLPIALRIASDPPSLAAFCKSFNKFYQQKPVQAQSLFKKICYQLARRNSYERGDSLLGQRSVIAWNIDTVKPAVRHLADYMQEEGVGIFSVYFDVLVFNSSYSDISPDTDWSDYDEVIYYLDDYFNIIECSSCEDRLPSDDMSYSYDDAICPSCRDRRYTWSDYEDTYVHHDYAISAIDQEGNRVIINSDNSDFEYDEDEDTYFHVEYDRGVHVIRGYHSSKNKISFKSDEWTRVTKRYIGVELEVECNPDINKNEVAKKISDQVNQYDRLMFFENDGSLRYGFEMITQPMSLPAQRKLFSFLSKKESTKHLKSHDTTSCGLHVHVSRNNMTDLQIGKIVSFINNPRHEWFIRAIARRYATGFCEIKSKKIKDCRSGDRYEAVNITNRNTIEFRMFKGSLKYEGVIAAIEFCNAIVEFTKPSVAGIRDLNTGRFMEFCNSTLKNETVVFRDYIDRRLKNKIDISDAA